MENVRFFMEPNESALLFNDEGIPYGPDWRLENILETMLSMFFLLLLLLFISF